MKKSCWIIALLCICLLLSGCRANTVARDKAADIAPGAPPSVGEMNGNFDLGEAAPSVPQGQPKAESYERKLIKTASYNMETLDYEETISKIEALALAQGGYVESSSSSGRSTAKEGEYSERYANYTLRIPVSALDGFGKALSECGSVFYSDMNVEEVSDYYYDTEAHLKALKLREERLLALMSTADTLENIIQLESALADVRYQIESNEGIIKRLDSQIDYSTVHISVQEVREVTQQDVEPMDMWGRIVYQLGRTWDGVKSFGEAFVVFTIGCSPILVPVIAAAVIIFIAVRRRYKKKKKTNIPPEPKEEK